MIIHTSKTGPTTFVGLVDHERRRVLTRAYRIPSTRHMHPPPDEVGTFTGTPEAPSGFIDVPIKPGGTLAQQCDEALLAESDKYHQQQKDKQA